MVGGGDENQVSASHQYLTARVKEIFPEYAAFADKTYLLIASPRFLGISNQGAEAGRLAPRRTAGGLTALKGGHNPLRWAA